MKSDHGIGKAGDLLEVWGDTVDGRHLVCSIAIGIVVSFGTYLLSARILTSFVASPDIARTDAMLVGLVGCITSGAVCTKLFPPKRVLLEQTMAPHWRAEVLEQFAIEAGSLGSASDLSASAARELKELNLYDVFVPNTDNNQPEDLDARPVAATKREVRS